MSGASSQTTSYSVPSGVLGLRGPVAKPAPGTLPLRGDLSHMALAGRHLAAHYVIPNSRTAGDAGADFLLAPREDADIVFSLNAGDLIEVLDTEGDWAWGCIGPDGPSGYCKLSSLAPEATGS